MKESYLMYSNIEGNNNKTLHIKVDGATLASSWARVGDSMQTKSWTFASPTLAEKMYNKKIKEKLKKGYEIVDTAGNTPITDRSSLTTLAANEIDVDSENTRELVRWLTTQNIHNICENTRIEYNSESNVFKTPIGVVVSQNTINKARAKLENISKLIASNTDTSLLTSEANAYLRLIPQNLGRARDKLDLNKIFGEKSAIAKQSDILDALEASLLSLLTRPAADATIEKTFECKLHLIKDQTIIKDLDTEITKSKKSSHLSALYGLKDVYEVQIPSMATSWQNYGAKLDNIYNLYHGTKCSNVLSILKRGLVTPKSGGKSGVAYDEIVIYREDQCNLMYLCEFAK